MTVTCDCPVFDLLYKVDLLSSVLQNDCIELPHKVELFTLQHICLDHIALRVLQSGSVVINCIARTRRVSVYFTVQRYLERALLRSKWICCTEFHYNMH